MEQFLYNHQKSIVIGMLIFVIAIFFISSWLIDKFPKRNMLITLIAFFMSFSLLVFSVNVVSLNWEYSPKNIENIYGDIVLEFTKKEATVNKKNTLISTVDKKEYAIENYNTIATVKSLLEKKPVAETFVENGTLKILYSDQEVTTLNIQEDSRTEQQKTLKNTK